MPDRFLNRSLRCDFQKGILCVVGIPTNTCKGEYSDIISDQWTALSQ